MSKYSDINLQISPLTLPEIGFNSPKAASFVNGEADKHYDSLRPKASLMESANAENMYRKQANLSSGTLNYLSCASYGPYIIVSSKRYIQKSNDTMLFFFIY